jgi:hypothetical protein
VHYSDNGSLQSRTVDPVGIFGETLEELRQDLAHYLEAFDKPVLEDAESEWSGFDEEGDAPTVAWEDVQREFELAPQEHVKVYQAEIRRMLSVMGFQGALVTDESLVRDFLSLLDTDDERAACLARWSEALGIPVHADEFLVTVAQRLRGTP